MALNFLSQQAHYDNVDHDIVQGEEEQGIQEEEGGKIKLMSQPYSELPCVLSFMQDFNTHFMSGLDSSEIQTCNLKPVAHITLTELS